jgi:hypothetical protein
MPPFDAEIAKPPVKIIRSRAFADRGLHRRRNRHGCAILIGLI